MHCSRLRPDSAVILRLQHINFGDVPWPQIGGAVRVQSDSQPNCLPLGTPKRLLQRRMLVIFRCSRRLRFGQILYLVNGCDNGVNYTDLALWVQAHLQPIGAAAES